MSSRQTRLGFSQPISLAWMDLAAQMTADTHFEARQIRQHIDSELAYGLDYKTARSIIAVLRAWFEPDSDLQEFQADLVGIVRQQPEMTDWRPLHWATLCAAYPFWHQTARHAMLLLRSQEQITSDQVLQRLKETYGDRSSVVTNGRIVLRSFVDWGILHAGDKRGRYRQANRRIKVKNREVMTLLLEAMLLAANSGRADFVSVDGDPALFPFDFPEVNGNDIATHPRLQMLRLRDGRFLLSLMKKGF